MLKKKMRNYIFLIFFLVTFFIGFINIVNSEEKATKVVVSTLEEDSDVVIVEGQIEKSIELGSKDYKRRGTYILIISSVGLLQTFISMRKKD